MAAPTQCPGCNYVSLVNGLCTRCGYPARGVSQRPQPTPAVPASTGPTVPIVPATVPAINEGRLEQTRVVAEGLSVTFYYISGLAIIATLVLVINDFSSTPPEMPRRLADAAKAGQTAAAFLHVFMGVSLAVGSAFSGTIMAFVARIIPVAVATEKNTR